MSSHSSADPSGLLAFVLLVMVVSPEARAGGSKTESPEDQVKIGAVDYKNFCAPCHGKDAGGNGPVAMELKTAPPSLRRLASTPTRGFRT